MQVDTTDGHIFFRYDMDQTFLLDDQILVRQIPDTHLNLMGIDPGNQVINDLFLHGYTLSFCEYISPGFHYDHLFHDPTMTMLYAPEIDTPTMTPKAKVQAKRAWIAAVVIVGIIVIAVVGFIILLQVKPELKSFFRPFRARNPKTL